MRLVALFLAVVGVALGAVAASESDALAKMDREAPKFTGMKAALVRVSYTQVIDDISKEQGKVAIRKDKSGLEMLLNVTTPDAKDYSFKGKKGQIYFPKINTVQEYDLGKNSAVMEHLLLLGFGTGGRELTASYLVSYVGEESITGKKTFHLQLAPKSPEIKEKVKVMDLWMEASGAYPVQQKITLTSDNYYLFTYSDIQYNPILSKADLALKLPSNVKRERP